MSRKTNWPAGHIAGGIAVALIIVAMAVALGGCTNPLSGGGGPVTVTPTPSPQPTAMSTPAATQTPSVTPTLIPTPAPTPEPTIAPEEITRTYEWTLNNQSHTVNFGMLKSDYDAYKNRPHTRGSDYAGYKISVDERVYIIGIVDRLMDIVQESDLNINNSAMTVAAFLQSMPGAQTDPAAPYDDYPKYPLETLADGGGDSEDMSILAANILNEMGYSTVLLGFPGHMAVGLQSNEDLPGRYYEYNGARYYYLETLPPLRGLGEIPDAYRNVSATIYTMQGAAGIGIDMTASPESSDDLFVYYHVRCNVANSGTQTAQNVSVYFASLALSYGEDQVWPYEEEINVGDIPAGEGRTAEVTLQIPKSGPTQIECIASGDNFDPVTAKGEQFSA